MNRDAEEERIAGLFWGILFGAAIITWAKRIGVGEDWKGGEMGIDR